MIELFYNTGSPYARAVRIVLAEKSLPFNRHESVVARDLPTSLAIAPTLQVPTLIDAGLKLWDSALIVEYLFIAYANPVPPADQLPLANDYVRAAHLWHDKLTHATLQTLTDAIVTLSQLERSGLRHEDNAFTHRCAARIQTLLDWCERELGDAMPSFVADVVSAQDILLACCCQLLERRTLRIHWQSPQRPRLGKLIASLAPRPSFHQEPALWWEAGIDYNDPAEYAWALTKTSDSTESLSAFRASQLAALSDRSTA